MLRATLPGDRDSILKLAEATGVFKPLEIVALSEVLDDYQAALSPDGHHADGHRAVTMTQDGQIIGFVYFAPAAMTDRTWYLYWIVVGKKLQGRGIGGQLLRHVEEEIRREKGRHLLIETSSLPHYEPTRSFYLKHGYELVATVPDFYAEGDHMLVYRKRI